MSRSTRTVTCGRKPKTDRLPEWAGEGAVVVQWLFATGAIEQITERLRIQREGGYIGVDLVLFVLFYLTARVDGGIKGFGEKSRSCRKQLGALGGRRELPTPASVSRVLSATNDAHTQDLSEWLLFDVCGAASVMNHPSVLTRDALGNPWHTFDLDPTVTVLRQRALPEGDDLPPPQRHSGEASLGYRGRKRGDVQISRMTLQHAGSSLWLGAWVGPGNGDWRENSQAAILRVRAICDRLEHRADRAFVRVDGAGGNVPLLTACQEAGVHYVTRWSQYEVLEEQEIRRHLNGSPWFAVASSGSGPSREAADLGWILAQPSDKTLRTDGSNYAPVRTRLVVSRFRARDPDRKRGAGTLLGGWQYELYATDLPADAWPAPDLVTAYYGRCGMENRFYQEDQHLGLDEIFSYHIPGQQLANLIGLFLWNLRVCLGFGLAHVPTEIPAQVPYTGELVVPTVTLPEDPPPVEPVDPVPTEVPGQVPCPTVGPTVLLPEHPPNEPPPAPTDGSDAPHEPSAEANPEHGLAVVTSVDDPDPHRALHGALDALDWHSLLQGRPGWRWEPQVGMHCPNNIVHHLQGVKVQGHDRTRQLRFRPPYLACAECSFRAGCTSSPDRLFRKETAITVASATAYPIHQLLHRIRGGPSPPTPALPLPPLRRTYAAPRPAERPTAVPPARRWEPSALAPGPFGVLASVLLPAKLRHHFARTVADIDVHVVVQPGPDHRDCVLFAITAAQRQNRRQTWAERARWNALPEDSHVRVEFLGADRLIPLLHPTLARQPDSKAA